MDTKRPSGQRPSARRMDTEDCAVYNCPQLARLEVIERRLSVLDGNGSDIAEGGIVGRLKRQHLENTKTLARIQWLVITTLLAMVVNLLAKVVMK